MREKVKAVITVEEREKSRFVVKPLSWKKPMRLMLLVHVLV
jgi:hypothetical protein